MTKKKVKYIIGLMTVALLGLVCFQMYWINFVIQAKNEQFSSDVRDAMHQVVQKLEKQEIFILVNRQRNIELSNKKLAAISRNSQPKPEKRIFRKAPQIAANAENIAPPTLNLEKLQALNLPSDILVSRNMEILPNGEIHEVEEHTIHINFDDIQKEINKNDGLIQDAIKKYESEQQLYTLQAKRKAVKKLKKTKEIAEVANSESCKPFDGTNYKAELAKKVFSNIFLKERDISDRIDKHYLDSLLKFEISQKGISLPFEYGISSSKASGENSYFFVSNKNFESQNSNKDIYEANLFPTDLKANNSILEVYFPKKTSFLLGNLWWTFASSLILLFVMLACFYIAVSTILQQKKVAEIKNDFINNMTHEFKTPISTISLATQMLQSFDMPENLSIFKRYLGIINDENKRLGNQVEKVLQTALIDKGDVELTLKSVNLHEIIEKVTSNISPQIDLKKGNVSLDLNAKNDLVLADEIHLTNVIFNLLDNAMKYSPESPDITIFTENLEENFVLRISDKGLGISKDSMKNIFEKFYRVPTGNRHDVKGFGLGLSYVKKMVEEHHGTVKVYSQLGVGSTFEVILPNDKAINL